ncbi:Transposon Tf2-6 polyprotein [Labeo rohita]|uniref:Gypsy retrotransposon integrase-like protein 1 n=1 Tax=Labeo rohita TaxID=84645 RepID=A0ABQ8L7E6_LABRO|nr:Transposon Tf2-6 polyprotein [Labeo rohita]
MDPQASDQSLQKTSPDTDPAAVFQLTTEVSAQATMLASHQQQLQHLTTLTEELVKTLQALRLADISPQPAVSPQPLSTPSHTTTSPRLAFPEKFDGSAGKCKGFLMQCSLFVSQQPQLYPTDDSRISFVCSLLTGRALDWATALWEGEHTTFPSFTVFLQSFREVFDHSAYGEEAGEQLLALRQGRSTAADYALTFRTLAAQTGWSDDPLKLLYRKGLTSELQSELACRDEGKSLDEFIELSIRIDNLARSRRPPRSVTTPHLPTAATSEPEPMQVGFTHLTAEERERRIRQHLCLYCGQEGHLRAACPIRPSPRKTNAVSFKRSNQTAFDIPVTLMFHDRTITAAAMIDSGAAGNFIDIQFANVHNIPLVACGSRVAVAALDGRPLGRGEVKFITDDITLKTGLKHTENIRLFAIDSPLNHHSGNANCLPYETITPPQQITIQPSATLELPAEYLDLAEAFSKTKASKLPPHRPNDCAIELIPGSLPPRGRIFPLSKPESEAMKMYIEEELAKGFIRPSTSPASAGFFFVKKKDGGLRPCIDYRGLNDITIKYRYPLPLVPSALEQLRSARYFTKLDLRNAYNLIRIREGDEWKTAFSTTTGHYEYSVMPFGLVNSPSVFQAFVNDVFRDMLNRWVIVYIDDILIFSDTLESHIQHVRAVLQRLIDHQLYAKFEKCEFHRTVTSFLGYIIGSEGVAMDDKKVQAVLNWPPPTSVKELQRFLGFANFYRRFIRNFSSVAAPLTSLLRGGGKRLVWTPEAERAFQQLKERFTSAPILHHPDPERGFVVEIDASNTGIGAVLSQRQGSPPKLFPCAFYSRKLSPTEQNYDVGDRELLAMKAAFEEWRHWLEGAKEPFIVLTDHRNLEYLRSAKRLNPRQARWSLFFTRFDFRVTYRPGSKNTKADALSRQFESSTAPSDPEPIIAPSLILGPIQWDIMTEITEAQDNEPPPPECPPERTYVPRALRQRVMQWVHDSPSSGHPGITATIHLVTNRFWWPSLQRDTTEFVRNCPACNISKSSHQRPAGLLQPLPVPQRPWSHIAIDYVTDLPASRNYTTILTVIDRFSKSCRLIPLTKLPSAFETAEVLMEQVFRFYGLPEDIVSDRGPQFTSRVWAAFCKHLNINVSLTSGYHPESNGQAERLNQELTRFLRTYCHNNQQDWSRYLLWAEYAQNSLRKPSTGLTPFQCVLGFQPPLFPWSGEPSELPSVNDWLQRSEETWNMAHVHLQRAIRRAQEQADRHRRPHPAYTPGQWVWLSSRDLRLRLPCRKLSPRYVGPFKILRQITPVSYRLELPAHYRISPTFHVSLLKPAGAPRGEEIQEEAADESTPPLVVDGEEAYQVHEILDSRRRGGVLQYLIDWEGYGPEERSWINARDILDPSLTAEFHRTHPERPAPDLVGDPGVTILLASGAARREGALS